MKYYILLIFVILVKYINGFLIRNHNRFSTHFNKINRINPIYSKKYDIYRLRRQKEILDAFESIFTRQKGLRVGYNITTELIQGISVMEVKLNHDCSHADIYIVASGDLFQQRQTFSWINKSLKRLRYLMAQLLNHRKNVPTLQFLPYDIDSELKDINEESDFNIVEDGHDDKKTKGWAGSQNQDEDTQSDHNTNIPYRKVNGLLLIQSI